MGLHSFDVDKEIQACKKHISETDGEYIGHFLTQYLIIRMCRDYEHEIRTIIVHRAKRTGDDELVSFVAKTFQSYKSLKLDQICGNILSRFSGDARKSFDAALSQDDCDMYARIIKNRDSIAHGQKISITIYDVKASHQRAKLVLEALARALDA